MSRYPDKRGLPSGTTQRQVLRITNHCAPETVRYNQAFGGGQEALWKILWHCEVKVIAILFVVGPFLVDIEVRFARLHLHHGDSPLGTDRRNIGTSPIGEIQLEDRREAHIHQETNGAAGDQRGDFRPWVHRRIGFDVQPWNSGRLMRAPSSLGLTPI